MKQLSILLITSYQKWASPIFKQLFGIKSFCRFDMTCSEYAKKAILENGVLRGGAMATKRILSCNPFAKSYTKAI